MYDGMSVRVRVRRVIAAKTSDIQESLSRKKMKDEQYGIWITFVRSPMYKLWAFQPWLDSQLNGKLIKNWVKN